MRGARSIFYAVFAQFGVVYSLLRAEAKRFLRAHLSPLDFSEVFLAHTRQEVHPGHFESYTNKERRLWYRRQNLIGSRNAIGQVGKR